MHYQHNVHFLMPAKKYEQLKKISKKLDLPRSQLVRKGVEKILSEYSGKHKNDTGDNR